MTGSNKMLNESIRLNNIRLKEIKLTFGFQFIQRSILIKIHSERLDLRIVSLFSFDSIEIHSYPFDKHTHTVYYLLYIFFYF